MNAKELREALDEHEAISRSLPYYRQVAFELIVDAARSYLLVLEETEEA